MTINNDEAFEDIKTDINTDYKTIEENKVVGGEDSKTKIEEEADEDNDIKLLDGFLEHCHKTHVSEFELVDANLMRQVMRNFPLSPGTTNTEQEEDIAGTVNAKKDIESLVYHLVDERNLPFCYQTIIILSTAIMILLLSPSKSSKNKDKHLVLSTMIFIEQWLLFGKTRTIRTTNVTRILGRNISIYPNRVHYTRQSQSDNGLFRINDF